MSDQPPSTQPGGTGKPPDITTLEQAVQAVRYRIFQLEQELLATIEELNNNITSDFQQVKADLTGVIIQNVNAVGNFLNNRMLEVLSNTKQIENKLDSLSSYVMTEQRIQLQNIGDRVNYIYNSLTSISDQITSQLKQIPDLITQSQNEVTQYIDKQFETAIKTLEVFYKSNTTEIIDSIDNISSTVKNEARRVISNVNSNINDQTTVIRENFNQVETDISQVVNNAKTEIQTTINETELDRQQGNLDILGIVIDFIKGLFIIDPAQVINIISFIQQTVAGIAKQNEHPED